MVIIIISHHFHKNCHPESDVDNAAQVALGMIAMAWLTPTAISFLPIFLGWFVDNHRDNR